MKNIDLGTHDVPGTGEKAEISGTYRLNESTRQVEGVQRYQYTRGGQLKRDIVLPMTFDLIEPAELRRLLALAGLTVDETFGSYDANGSSPKGVQRSSSRVDKGRGRPRLEEASGLFADASRWTDDSYAFAFELLEKAGVGVAPGVDFGQAEKRAVRWSSRIDSRPDLGTAALRRPLPSPPVDHREVWTAQVRLSIISFC